MEVSLTVWAPMPSEGIDPDVSTYKPGDVISCDGFIDGISSHPRFILFNITNMPDNSLYDFQFRRIKRMLESKSTLGLEQDEIRRRAWRVNFSLMPTNMQQSVRDTRGITISWVQAKEYLCRRDIINESDYTQDGNLFLLDEDL